MATLWRHNEIKAGPCDRVMNMYTKLKQKDGKRSKKTIVCSRKILNVAFNMPNDHAR